jgi:hypothetical protein
MPTITVDQIFEEIVKEADGPVNRYYAWRDSGHEPDSQEAFKHFLEHGGVEFVEREKLGIPEHPANIRTSV